jgi:hypothetical protein
LADAPQLSQVSQELSLCAVGAKDNGFDLVNVLIKLAHSGISIKPTDITGAFVHQDLTVDHGVIPAILSLCPLYCLAVHHQQYPATCWKYQWYLATPR